ncbi:hypothetical protein B0J17DRAFT_624548 [Rhizoctonia solani]|nr:hypothetical protein B0J17DRAFT_624548 [Rhizoctonia solani]
MGYTWTRILGEHVGRNPVTFIQSMIDTLLFQVVGMMGTNSDFPDLVARFIALLKPAATQSYPEAEDNCMIKESLAFLFDQIAELSTGTEPDQSKRLFQSREFRFVRLTKQKGCVVGVGGVLHCIWRGWAYGGLSRPHRGWCGPELTSAHL